MSAYKCVKCKKNHVRGSIFEAHRIYDEANSIDITPEIEADPWDETCHNCIHHDKLLDQGGHICLLLVREWEKYYKELSSFSWNYKIPKAAFRVPRTSEIYRKCPYWKMKNEV